jgi:hypothetical protein
MEDDDLLAGYQAVYTVTDDYDGSLKAIASYLGQPHFYDRIYDEKAEEYSDLFQLTPIDPDTFRLAIEDWDIWRRWEFAYYTGKAKFESHPALPNESARHAELDQLLKGRLVTNPTKVIVRIGHFTARGNVAMSKGFMRPQQVKWSAP